MKHIYKKNKYYYYKRRIPLSDKFFSFNTYQSSYKKAFKIVLIFDKFSRNLFEHLKIQGNELKVDFNEVSNVLEEYKKQALKEYSEYEESRHVSLGKVFKIEKEIPLIGKKPLTGGHPEVIKAALELYEYLSISTYSQNKTDMVKHGKDIVERSTSEVKKIFSQYRKNKKDEENLLYFLGMLFKYEASILQEDLLRAKSRFEEAPFGNLSKNIISEHQNQSTANPKKNSLNLELFSTVGDNFLSNSFTEEALDDTKSNAYKVKSIVTFLTDFCLHEHNVELAKDLREEFIIDALSVIRKLPKKISNSTKRHDIYNLYKKNPDIVDPNLLKSETTLKGHIKCLMGFIKYLSDNEYLSAISIKNINRAKEKELNLIKRCVNDGLINGKIDVQPFKDEMIKNIFNKDYKPYSILFKDLNESSSSNKDVDMLITRFYVPIIMFFIGSRVEEITNLKTTDCGIETIDEKEKLMLYIRGTKTKESKRIVLVHDYLANDLNLIKFVKKAQNEKRDFLFTNDKDGATKVSKEFNRYKDFLKGNIEKSDDFINARYSLYSFRHYFRTHMTNIGVNEGIIDKIQGHKRKENEIVQGYLSLTPELSENINRFNKHEIVDWTDFIKLTDTLSK